MTESILGNILQKIIIGVDQDKAKKILDTIPAGISIATDASCKEIIHNSKAAEFLRIKSWENLSYSDSKEYPARLYHKGKKLSHEEMPIQRSAWKGEEIKGFEIEFIWDDGDQKTSVLNSRPLFDESGSIVGAIASFDDITGRKKAEKALLESEEVFQRLVETSPAAVIVFRGERHLYVNPAAVSIFGYSREELLAINYLDLLHPEFKDMVKRQAQARMAGQEKLARYEVKIITKTCEEKWLDVTSNLINYKGLRAGIVVCLDITERKKIECELKESRKKYQDLIETNVEFVWEMDTQGRYTYCSPQMEKLWGLKPEDMIGKTPFDSMPLDVRERVVEEFIKNANSPGGIKEMETTAYDAQGNLVFLETRGLPFFDDNGVLQGYRGITRDITARKRAEADLVASEEKYRLLHESMHDAFVRVTLDGQILEFNKLYMDMLGYTKEELLNLTYMDLTPAKWHAMEAEIIDRLIITRGFSDVYEKEYQRKDGTVFPVELNSFLIRDKDGEPDFMWAIIRDITKRKQEEKILKSNRQLLEELVQERTRELEEVNQRTTYILESIKVPFFALDSQWRFIYMNSPAKEDYGDLLGKNVWSMFPKMVGTVYWEKYHEVMESKKPLVFETLYTGFWSEANVYPYGEGISVLFRDITERKKAEEALRHSEERFYKTFESSPLFMTVYSLDRDEFIAANSNSIKTLGFPTEELIGHSTSDLKIWASEEERSKFLEEIKRNGNVNSQEINFRIKSGEIITMLVSGVVTQIDGESCIISTGIDISELRNLQKEMTRLDRLNLIGEMAAGIGHEVRNPMTTIKGFLQLLGEKERYAQDRDYFQLMVDELDRANSIISEFLSLAKNKAVELEMKNLNKILKAILPLIQADGLVTDKYIDLKTKKIPDLMLDEKEIRQLVLNLVRNGLQAMEPGKTLTLETFIEEDNVVLAVMDQGAGIPDEIIDKIGTPFFTTKDTGTGLGLAVCYSIAARHNARIDVETGSEGTTFFIRFKMEDSD